MDCINWCQDRYNEIVTETKNFLHQQLKVELKNVYDIPCSGEQGINLIMPVAEHICSWYDGFCLLDQLDKLKVNKKKKAKK